MSHLVTIQTQVRDSVAIASACTRLDLPSPVHREVKLFTSVETGWAVELPDWRYPIVCQTDSGQLKYDNFEGRWGDPAHLDRFVQSYAVEKIKLQARRQGQTAIEEQLQDGSIRVQIAVTN